MVKSEEGCRRIKWEEDGSGVMDRIYGLPGMALESVAYAVGIDMVGLKKMVELDLEWDIWTKISDDEFRHDERS